jgi:hypothetical protein
VKKVYVAHKFQGKKQNREAITHICRALVKLGILPISPVHAFSYLHDNIPEERERALEFSKELIETCDALFLTGEWEDSEGCIEERNTALIEMIPIYIIEGWNGDVPLFKGEGPKWMKERDQNAKKVNSITCHDVSWEDCHSNLLCDDCPAYDL